LGRELDLVAMDGLADHLDAGITSLQPDLLG